MKYIRMGERIYLFSNDINHREFAITRGYPNWLVHSAGFVTNVDGQLKCTGKSISLDRESREDDTELLLQCLAEEVPPESRTP